MSCILFHGPGAREEAIERAGKIGRLLVPPFEGDKLKTEDVRETLRLLSAAPIGSKIGVVVLGPVDNIPVQAADSMLKPLEEFDARNVQPLLWARDAGDVLPTVRSRCLLEWCPAGPDPDLPHLDKAQKIVEAAISRDWATVVSVLKEDKAAEMHHIVAATASVFAQMKGTHWMPLWLQVRKVLRSKNPSRTELVSAFMVTP